MSSNTNTFIVRCIKDTDIGGISGEYVKISDINKNNWKKIPTLKKKELTPYRCTHKNSHPIRPKMGEIIIHHFAHFSNTTCNGESQEHIQSKMAIYQYAMNWAMNY